MTSNNVDIQAKRLIAAPLSETGIHFRLRRALMRAGYDTLFEAFRSSESELASKLEDAYIDALLNLKEIYETDPERFVDMTKPQPSRHSDQPRSAVNDRLPRNDSRTHSKQGHLNRQANLLPNIEELNALSSLEPIARSAVLDLVDHRDEAILAETFSPLGRRVDEIHSAFLGLFNRYNGYPRRALDYTQDYFPNAFLVFVADLARKEHDGSALWKNVFFELGFPDDSNVQRSLKLLFLELLQKRGFPHYAQGEDDFYLLYTALLHGGFSESFWYALWDKTILPYARELSVGLSSRSDAYRLLEAIRDEEDHSASANTFVNRMLQKTADSTLIPLLYAALRTASTVADIGSSTDAFEMFTVEGLPDTATVALRHVLEEKSRKKLVYLPHAEMRLEPMAGKVLLHWDEQRFPQNLSGFTVVFRVNGEVMLERPLLADLGKLILEEVDIPITPSRRFDIEITLVGPNSQGVERRLARTEQTFERSRPGAFEFIEERDGVFKLRKPGRVLHSAKKMAYLIKNTRTVVPGVGMSLVEEYDGRGEWGNASIQLFSVEPGAAGSIIDLATREIVASWQENYSVDIDRRHVIGKADDGRDLYGFAPNSIDTNDALPVITIESFGAESIRGDLDITCICDGKRVSLLTKSLPPDERFGSSGRGKLFIFLNETMMIDRIVADGMVTIRQRSSGNEILRYKFAVVPIQSFKLIEAYFDGAGGRAAYEISAKHFIDVEDEGYTWPLRQDETYEFEAPLGDEWREMRITGVRSGVTVMARLSLVAMTVSSSPAFYDVASKRDIALSDCDELDGRMNIRTTGRRRSRKAFLLVGGIPVFFRAFTGTSELEFDLLSQRERFLRSGEGQERFEMLLCINYGTENRPGKSREHPVDMHIASCVSGANLGELAVRLRQEGHCVTFSRPAQMDYEARFTDRRGRELGTSQIEVGDMWVVLPEAASYSIRTKKPVSMTLVPVSLFGVPAEDDAITLSIGG